VQTSAGKRTQLAAGIALHGLGLAIPGKVVGAAALVASSRAGAASEASPEASSKSTPSGTSAASQTSTGVGAVASQMSRQTAAVAPAAGAGSAQTKGRAVSLDVPKALAVVALLSCCLVSVLVETRTSW
jgi:hypothetical protein